MHNKSFSFPLETQSFTINVFRWFWHIRYSIIVIHNPFHFSLCGVSWCLAMMITPVETIGGKLRVVNYRRINQVQLYGWWELVETNWKINFRAMEYIVVYGIALCGKSVRVNTQSVFVPKPFWFVDSALSNMELKEQNMLKKLLVVHILKH